MRATSHYATYDVLRCWTPSSTQDSKTSDLLFLIDATGSMTPVIKAAKEKILEIVKKTAEAPYPEDGWTLRLGFVAYRDFGISPQFLLQDFTSDAEKFRDALGKIQAFSGPGPDIPEDVFGGIELATMFSWESASRTIIHFADAPCHGVLYHDLGARSDNFAAGDPLGRNIRAMLGALKTHCKASMATLCVD